MTEEHDIEAIVERLAKIADHTLDSRRAEGYFYAGHIEALIADWRAKKAEIERLRKLDQEAATYVESVIAMRTVFTGDPPYVGWEGLGLALSEALDELDRLRQDPPPLPQSTAYPADSQDGQA